MRSLTAILVVTLLVLSWWPALAAEPIKVGIIGMDAHALPWTQIINNPNAPPEIAAMRIVAGFPGGSTDIPTSQQILAGSVEPCRKLGVEIVDSIDQLLAKVDAVMILSIDGRTHLPYAKKVFASGKPVFIDKPLAASLADAEEIYRLAKQHSVPCFSSSALRFAPGTQAVLTDPKVGPILGCDAFSPLFPRAAPPRPLLVRHPRRRDPLHHHGPGLPIGQPHQDRRCRCRRRRLEGRPHRHLPRHPQRTTHLRRQGLRHQVRRRRRQVRRLRAAHRPDRRVLQRPANHPSAPSRPSKSSPSSRLPTQASITAAAL